ncbi:MAG: hypothetical protein V3571_08150, partial [Pseudodesulfovibrio sp.]
VAPEIRVTMSLSGKSCMGHPFILVDPAGPLLEKKPRHFGHGFSVSTLFAPPDRYEAVTVQDLCRHL